MALKHESKLIQANIRDVQAGKSSAYEQLYRVHVGRIYKFGLKIFEYNKQAADELTKRVFIKGFEQINSFPGEITFILWLRKFAVEEIRKGNIKKTGDAHKASPADEAIFSLPVEERIVFILSDVEKLSIEEITRITQKSAEDINTNLEKARKHLMESLKVDNQDDLDYKINFVSQKTEPGDELWNVVYNQVHSIATKDMKEETDGNVLNVGDAKVTLGEKLEKLKQEKPQQEAFLKLLGFSISKKIFYSFLLLVIIAGAIWYFFFVKPPGWEVTNLSGSPTIQRYNRTTVVEKNSLFEINELLITDVNSKAVIKIPQIGEIYLNPGSSVKRDGDVGELTIYYGGINVIKKTGLEPFPVEVFSAKIEDYKAGSYSVNMDNKNAEIYSESAGLIISSEDRKIYLIPGYECLIEQNARVGMPFSQSVSEDFIEAVNIFISEREKENLNGVLLLSERKDALTLINILLIADKSSRDIVINKLHSLVSLPKDVNPYQMSNLNEKDIIKWLEEIEKVN